MVGPTHGLAVGVRWPGTGGTTPHERAVCVSTPERHLRRRHDAASVRGRRAVSADCISSSNFLRALRRAAAATLPPPMKNEPRGGDAARRRGRSTACAENRDLEISPKGSWRGAAPAPAAVGAAPLPPSAECVHGVLWVVLGCDALVLLKIGWVSCSTGVLFSVPKMILIKFCCSRTGP